jgi:hypothetical protein
MSFCHKMIVPKISFNDSMLSLTERERKFLDKILGKTFC